MRSSFLIFSILVATRLQGQINLTSSLTGCYPLNGNAQDYTSGLTGIPHNINPSTDRNNNPGSAIEFVGNALSFVELPNNSLLQSTVAITFSGWVYFNAFQDNDFLVFTKNNSTSTFAAYSLISYNDGGGYRFRIYKENGASDYLQGTTLLSLNKWYHVAFSIDNTWLKLYVDGFIEDLIPSTASFDYDISGKNVILGGTNEVNFNKPFQGKMDNVRFYNRTLTVAEILALYQQDPICIASTVGSAEATISMDYVVFPHPVEDVLNVELFTNLSSRSRVYDVLGQLVRTIPLNSGVNQISVEDLRPGLYILELEGVDKTKRFIKK